MSAILSNWASFNALKKGIWKNSYFIGFMNDIIGKLMLWGYESCKIGVILDNWSIHRSRTSIEFMSSMRLNIYFIPIYWPEVAPIEKYFSILKSKYEKNAKDNH